MEDSGNTGFSGLYQFTDYLHFSGFVLFLGVFFFGICFKKVSG